MRRRLNSWGLLAVIGLTAGLALGVHLLHEAQAKRNARALLDQAELAESAGNKVRAKDYLGRYLTYEPDDANSLTKYVQTLDPKKDPGELQQAVGAYERALRRDPGRDDVRRHLVDLLMEMAEGDPERYADAKAHLEPLVANAPDDPGLAYLLGRAEEGLGHFPEAIALYEKARADVPNRVDGHVRLAELLRGKTGEADRADRVMDASTVVDGLISRDDRSASAYLARARYRKKHGVHPAEADADVARAFELAPDDADAIRAAAASARDRGDLVKAREQLQRGVALHPRILSLYEDLADLEWRAGRPEKAIASFRQALEVLPNELTACWSLADLLIRDGRMDGPEGAGVIIEKMREGGTRPELLGLLEARILTGRKRWAEAAATLDRAYPALLARPDTKGVAKQALVMLGECSERLGNLDRAYEAYRRAAGIEVDPDPLWATAHLKLAGALSALNRVDDALAECRTIYARAKQAGPILARLLIFQSLRLPAAERARRLEEADRVVGQLLREQPEADDLTILRAEIQATSGRIPEARQLLVKARDRHPDSVDLWVTLAALAALDRPLGEALSVLDEAGRRLGDLVGLRLARAGLLSRRADADAETAGTLEALERGLEKFPAEDQARLLEGLASAYGRINRADHAEQLWRRAAESRPDDLTTRLVLFDLAFKSGDAAAQGEALHQIDRIEGGRQDGPLWQYGRARLLTSRSQGSPSGTAMLAEARTLLGRVAERRPTWSRAPMALAEVAELSGDTEGALENYMRGILDLGDRSPSAIQRATRLLAERGRQKQIDELIRRLKEDGQPLSAELQRLAAAAALQSHDHGRALELAEKLVPSDTKDHRELIWIGQIREATGQDAEPALRRAVAMAEDAPEAWVALVLYLSRHDRAKAEAAAREAEGKLSTGRTPLALAACFEAIGRADRADELFREALAARPDDRTTRAAVAGFQIRAGRPQEAKPHLRRILELGGTSPEAEWARQTLALLTANGRTPQDEREALKLLEDPAGHPTSGHDRGPTVAAMRTRAKILAVQPGSERRREAIAILEEVAGREPATAEDLSLMAHLYESIGDWDKARRCLLTLVELPGEGRNHLSYFILALLRHGRVDEAQAYLNRLEGLAPGQGGVVELKARVLKAQGRDDEAVALLRDYAKVNEARVGLVARLLEELGRPDAAEPFYRRFAEKYPRPETVLTLAAFYGRQGRIREALDLCDRAWPAVPALASTSSVIILYSDKSDDTLRDRVGQKIEEALREHPERTSLRLDLANLRSLQGRYAEAESIYRGLFEENKSSVNPLNNLAWLLALTEGRGSEALALIRQAIEMKGETPDLLDTRAMAYLALGRPNDAARDLENSVVASPGADKYLHLARAYRLAGKPRDTEEALRKAKELGLNVETLHPLERASYNRLVGNLATK